MRGPSIPAGQRREGLCYLHDVFPTILDLAGVPVPDGCEGISLLPVLSGRDAGLRDCVFSAFQRSQDLDPDDSTQRMVRRGSLKLIETRMGDRTHRQLFDLADDPWETRNLADDPAYSGPLADLQRLLVRERVRVGDLAKSKTDED